eukprot:scaffold593689_cov30-Prasinocladus_malaysianus.AAC.1
MHEDVSSQTIWNSQHLKQFDYIHFVRMRNHRYRHTGRMPICTAWLSTNRCEIGKFSDRKSCRSKCTQTFIAARCTKRSKRTSTIRVECTPHSAYYKPPIKEPGTSCHEETFP